MFCFIFIYLFHSWILAKFTRGSFSLFFTVTGIQWSSIIYFIVYTCKTVVSRSVSTFPFFVYIYICVCVSVCVYTFLGWVGESITLTINVLCNLLSTSALGIYNTPCINCLCHRLQPILLALVSAEPEQFDSVLFLLKVWERCGQRLFSIALLPCCYSACLAISNHLHLIWEIYFHLEELID